MKETGIGRNSLRRLLESLEVSGLVAVVREGRSRRYYLTERLAQMRDAYGQRRDSTAESIKEVLNGLVGKFNVSGGVDGFIYIGLGNEELAFGTDPFISIFTG